MQNRFAVRAFGKTASQTGHPAYDSCNMNPALMPADRLIQKKMTMLKENNHRDEFIRRKMTKLNCFYDIELWESFQEEFVNWTRRDFELTSISCCRAFRTYLRRKEVWIFKETISAKFLYDAFKKKTFTSWTEDEIKRSLSEMRFTFYLMKEFLKAPSDEILQRQKHEVSIDHEEFMTERYTSSLVSSRLLSQKYSSPIFSRSFAPSSSSLSVDQSIKHSQSENQVFPSLAIPQGLLIIDNSNHVPIIENSEHPDEPSDELSVEPSDKSQVESSDELLVEQSSFKSPSPKNQRRSVERSDRPSISSLRSFASPTLFIQSGRQPTGQSMGQPMRRLMGQLIRRSMNQPISDIHVRCGIEWMRKLLKIRNRDGFIIFKVTAVCEQKVLSTYLVRLIDNLTE